MKKVTDESLLDSYYLGWEHQSNDVKMPDWFNSDIEKYAYLKGIMDFDLDLHKNNDEILKEIKREFK